MSRVISESSPSVHILPHKPRQRPSRFLFVKLNLVQLRRRELQYVAHEPPTYSEPPVTDDMNFRYDDSKPRSSAMHGTFSSFPVVTNNPRDIAIVVNLLSH